MSATDLDVSVTSAHDCEVLREGKVAVPAKQLFEPHFFVAAAYRCR